MEEILLKLVDRVPDLALFAGFAWLMVRGFLEYLKGRDTEHFNRIFDKLDIIDRKVSGDEPRKKRSM